MTNTDHRLPSSALVSTSEPFGPEQLATLLRLIAYRADSLIGGPSVDAKIAELMARGKDSGWILATLTVDDLRPVRIAR